MLGIDAVLIDHTISLPCTKVLSFDARNVLSGVLAVAEQEAERQELANIGDTRFGFGAVRINCAEWFTIEQLVSGINQLVGAELLIKDGVRYKLSGLLAVEYADYVANQTTSVA